MEAFFEKRAYSQKKLVYMGVLNDFRFAAHWHADIELIYVISGRIGVGINTCYKELSSGDFALLSENEIHYFNSLDEESTILTLFFEADLVSPLSSVDTAICLKSYIFSDVDEDGKNVIQAIITDLIRLNSTDKPSNQHLLKLSVLELLLAIFRYEQAYYASAISPNQTFDAAKPIQTAIHYIQANYAQDIQLNTISDIAGLSPYYFSRLFKKTTGTNFKKYLTHVRINKAVDLICNSQKKIIDIAYETGFNSIRTFNRTFVDVKGHPPILLRKNY